MQMLGLHSREVSTGILNFQLRVSEAELHVTLSLHYVKVLSAVLRFRAAMGAYCQYRNVTPLKRPRLVGFLRELDSILKP